MNLIKTVTVLGANGTMGQNISAIFASFGNAKVYLVSRDIKKSEDALAKAYCAVRAESVIDRMVASDYSHLEECVLDSDLIFEACAENWSIKNTIHKQLANILEKHNLDRIICTGTSGLSVTKLAENYSERIRPSFMGMHFFNPPYQLTLCEIIPTEYSKENIEIFEYVKEYATDILRRTVVETGDTPAFLGNRIGFQFINEALQLAEEYKFSGGIDYIDAILGSYTGRLMSPIMTANFVGLDVHKAIVNNIFENTNDYAHETFVNPNYVEEMIADGRTGRKAGVGLYKTIVHASGAKIHQVYDIEHGYYREQIKYSFPFAVEMKKNLKIGNYSEAFEELVNNESIEAKICCSSLLKYIIYSMNAAKEVGCLYDAADDVMATGFNWCPPIALYEAFCEVTDFKKLCEDRLPAKIISVINDNHLLDNIGKSKYDYRRYILAK